MIVAHAGFVYTFAMTKKCSLPQAAAEQKKAGRELTKILTCAVMNSPATVVITGADGTIEYVNRKFSALTGYAPAESIGRKASLLKSGLMPEAYYKTLWRRLKKGVEWTGEFHNRKKNGEFYWELASISPVRDAAGRIRHYLKLAEDITERKRLETDLRNAFDTLQAHEVQLRTTCRQLTATTRALKKSESTLQRLSQEDALTGLLNRRGFDSALRRVSALAERQGHGIGFLIVDVDHFKLINDRYGHAAGDRILKAFADLLRSLLRTSDLLCRYGGDELVVALPSADAEATRVTAERILAAVRQCDFLKGRAKHPITVSIGAACATAKRGQSFENVLKQADRALYQVKRNGRNGIAFAVSGEAASSVRSPHPAALVEDPCRPQDAAHFDLLLAMLDAREKATGAHCRRVAQITGLLTRALRLPADQAALITRGALFHDIGKIAVPETLLLKPGPLTAAERKIVQEHPKTGHGILRVCPGLKAVSDLVLCHHERLDGSGYPRGLKGSRIGLGARILAAADTYDAIRAGRPYAATRSAEEALRELRRCRGKLFDSDVVDALARCQGEIEGVLTTRPA